MKSTSLSPKQQKAIERFQKDEINGHLTYLRLSKVIKNPENAQVLSKIAHDEKLHYDLLKRYSGKDIAPNRFKIWWFFMLARIFGITFGVKLLERREEKAQAGYLQYVETIPDFKRIIEHEEEHEKQLIDLINEERLKYVGSIVLGLNDALVELTGSLAGFSLAMQNSKIIAMAGLITGIAASFSMAASDYLSQKADGEAKDALKSSVYTGVAYIVTVALLILPYLLLDNYLICLGITLSIAILIILGFNYYISIAKDLNFKQRFTEMALISLGVSALSFGIGFAVKHIFGIEI